MTGILRDLAARTIPVLLALLLVAGTAAAADTPTPAPPPWMAGDTAEAETVIAPLPDEAVQGAYCLAGAAAAMIAVFAIGPTEGLMVMSGAMHVPSGTAVLIIPLLSILGGSSCALAAAAQPAIGWAIEQSDNIADNLSAQFNDIGPALFTGGAARAEEPAGGGSPRKGGPVVAPPRPLTEDETQSAGCVAGALAGFGGALASSPTEIAMLSSGANTIVSSTPLLVLGLVSSIVASGCVIGTYAILPIQAFFNNFSAIGDSLFSAVGEIGAAVSERTARTLAVVTGLPYRSTSRSLRRPDETS